jgi:hypothetical protein
MSTDTLALVLTLLVILLLTARMRKRRGPRPPGAVGWVRPSRNSRVMVATLAAVVNKSGARNSPPVCRCAPWDGLPTESCVLTARRQMRAFLRTRRCPLLLGSRAVRRQGAAVRNGLAVKRGLRLATRLRMQKGGHQRRRLPLPRTSSAVAALPSSRRCRLRRGAAVSTGTDDRAGVAAPGQTRPRYRTAPAWLLSARRSREART